MTHIKTTQLGGFYLPKNFLIKIVQHNIAYHHKVPQIGNLLTPYFLGL